MLECERDQSVPQPTKAAGPQTRPMRNFSRTTQSGTHIHTTNVPVPEAEGFDLDQCPRVDMLFTSPLVLIESVPPPNASVGASAGYAMMGTLRRR